MSWIWIAICVVFFVTGLILLKSNRKIGFAILSWIFSFMCAVIYVIRIPYINDAPSESSQAVQEVSAEVRAKVQPDVQIGSDTDLAELIAQKDNAIVIALEEDYRLDTTLVIRSGKRITLMSVGENMFSLTASGDFDAVLIENGAALTIDGINILRFANTVGRGIHNWGTLILENGNVAGHFTGIEGALGWGAGVMNDAGATFTMRGGTITQNTTATHGGGIFTHPNATFKMENGEISNNSSRDGGGVENWGVFTMRGGTISDNISSSDGGGIANSGELRLLAGEILRNTANNDGGGVVNFDESVFTMQGSHIFQNSAPWGGGVANYGRFYMHAGDITDNRAENNGGGLWSYEDANTSIMGGQILNNSPDDQYTMEIDIPEPPPATW